MQPIIVILGRPNVGKSTLFNRLAQRRMALVHDTPGVTRDRKEVTARIAGRDVTLVDTAGLEEAPPDTVPGRMRASSEAALRGASLVLFVMDARAGITPADRAFAAWLRRMRVPVLVVANKAEGRAGTTAAMLADSSAKKEAIAKIRQSCTSRKRSLPAGVSVLKRICARPSIMIWPSTQPSTAPSNPAIMPCNRNSHWISPSVKPSDFRMAISRVFSNTTVEMIL